MLNYTVHSFMHWYIYICISIISVFSCFKSQYAVFYFIILCYHCFPLVGLHFGALRNFHGVVACESPCELPMKVMAWISQKSWKWKVMPLKKFTSKCSSDSIIHVLHFFHTVDGRNLAYQLRLVGYLMIYRVLYIPSGPGFSSINIIIHIFPGGNFTT